MKLRICESARICIAAIVLCLALQSRLAGVERSVIQEGDYVGGSEWVVSVGERIFEFYLYGEEDTGGVFVVDESTGVVVSNQTWDWSNFYSVPSFSIEYNQPMWGRFDSVMGFIQTAVGNGGEVYLMPKNPYLTDFTIVSAGYIHSPLTYFQPIPNQTGLRCKGFTVESTPNEYGVVAVHANDGTGPIWTNMYLGILLNQNDENASSVPRWLVASTGPIDPEFIALSGVIGQQELSVDHVRSTVAASHILELSMITKPESANYIWSRLFTRDEPTAYDRYFNQGYRVTLSDSDGNEVAQQNVPMNSPGSTAARATITVFRQGVYSVRVETDWWNVTPFIGSISFQFPDNTSTASLPQSAGLYQCPLPIAQITPLTSRVENPQLSHIHTATDYQSAGGAAGCGPCGASSGAGGGLTTDVRLDRIHRYADFTRAGSFGPGVFSNLDIQLMLWDHGAAGEIWDPSAASAIPLTATGTGLYADHKRSAISGLRLYAADGTTLAGADSAVTAVATQHDGSQWIFELVQAGIGGDADRQGRLTAIRDRAGNQLSIAYAFPATATDAQLGVRSRLLEMASATDQRGRQLTFAYGWSCGQPVITTLTYPTGEQVVYRYDGDLAGVSAIDYPDGTHSAFTTRLDAASQTQVIDYQDAGAAGTHRTKSVHLTLTDWINADGTRTPQSPNRVRRVIGPTGEPTYLNWLERDGDQVQIYVFEGGGIAGTGRMLRLDTTEGVTDATWIATQWSFATEPSTWTWEKVADYATDARFRMGAQTDPLGKSTAYDRDPASGAITGRTHRNAAGAVVSRESTQYNPLRLPTRHVDANGLVTRSTYDAQGNLLDRTEGIALAIDGITEDASAATTMHWTYRADGQVLSETDALGRVTDYEYDARGFRTAEVSPPDDPALPLIRARKTWHYDAAGRLDLSTDASGHTTQYRYDSRNRVREVIYGNGSHELYAYGTGADANLLQSKTDRDGVVTTFTYDAAGRETSRTEGAQDPAVAITTTTTYLEGTDLPQTVTRAGQKTEYLYDTRKRVVETRRWVDGTRYLADSTVFDAADRVAFTADAFGRRTYQVYDDLDRVVRTVREAIAGGVPSGADLASLTRPGGVNPAYVIEDTGYDAGGRVLTTTDARGIITQMAYDSHSRVTDRWEAFGTADEGHWSWTYDDAGNRSTETDPLGHVTTFAYTGRNLLASQTVAFGTADAATTRFTYTLTGQRATQRDPNNHTSQWIYAGCCDWLDQYIDAADFITRYTYTPGGLIHTVTDPNLHVTTTTHDGLKRPQTVRNGDGEVSTTVYDDDLTDDIGLSDTYAAELAALPNRLGCRAVAQINALGETVVRVSDGLGRVVLAIDAARHVTRMAYDQPVALDDDSVVVETTTTDAVGHVTRQRSDGLGRVREVVDAQDAITTLGYDANGNRLTVTDALGHGTTCTFDARNRQTACTDAVGNTTRVTYDALGNVLSQVDGLNHATIFTYTARNQKQTETDRLNHTTVFSYDPAGNLLSISDAENEAAQAAVTPAVYEAGKTRYAYTPRNQLLSESFPGATGGTRSYSYHPNGLLQTRTDQRGIVTTYGYDGANRLISRSYSDAPADDFALDDAGRITSASSGRYGTVVERTWLPTGLLDSETTTWPAEVSGVSSSTLVQYGYDAANRVVSVTYPDGATLARTFTSRNQLDTLTLGAQLLATAGYDDAGRRTSLAYGNGLTDTRGYTDDNRLLSTVVGAAAPALPALSLGYGYDANRRKTTETDSVMPSRSQHFAYDDADRLTSWHLGATSSSSSSSQSWQLSPVGDWTSTTRNGVAEHRTHTAVHEIAAIDTTPVLHDASGNLARTAQGQGFSWDAENRLLQADIAPNPEKTQGTATYWYDALGRRVASRVHGSVTRYVHDGWQVIQELDAPATATAAEAASDGALASLATVPDGALLYPTFDGDGTRRDPTRINFQPTTEAIPEGFLADKGRAFAVRTNGLSYGWDGARTDAQVRRVMPLPPYDTLAHLDGGSWRIALPNGTYPVAIVAGDAISLAHANHLVVNGQALTDPDPGDAMTVAAYDQGDFDGWLIPVTVTDGFLTITAGSGAFDPTLCFMEIGQLNQPITPAMQTRLAEQIDAATARTGGAPFWNGGRVETRTYVWDPAYIDHLIAYQRATIAGTQLFYTHAGAQFSVQAVSDANGQVVERYAYNAYGDRTVEGSGHGRSAIGLTTGFTGRAIDEETGLYYFRNRMYSGRDGRFVSRDPLGYVDGYSLYRGHFVPGKMDPSGLITQDQLMRVLRKLSSCKDQEVVCPANFGEAESYVLRWMLEQAHNPGLKYEDVLQASLNGIKEMAGKVKSTDKLLETTKIMAEIAEVLGELPAHSGVGADIDSIRERLHPLSNKLNLAKQGLGTAISAIVIARGMGADASAGDQVNALGSIMQLAGQFAVVPGVSDIISGYATALKNMAKNIEAIGERTFEADLAVLENVPCMSLNQMHPNPAAQNFWPGFMKALNIPKTSQPDSSTQP